MAVVNCTPVIMWQALDALRPKLGDHESHMINGLAVIRKDTVFTTDVMTGAGHDT